MNYIDFDKLEQIKPDAYRNIKPFPWINPEGLLTSDGYAGLVGGLPDKSLFTPFFDKPRKHGQYPHNRYTLEYDDSVPIPPAWKAFIGELTSARYRRHICRLLGVRSVKFNFHWHFTPRGASVSPHCDSRRKLGSHIFYLNTEDEWQRAWGGETLVLDDGGRFDPDSAPSLEEFDSIVPANAIGNRSLIFTRSDRSWHAVKEISAPEGHLRKVFIVVFNVDRPIDRIRRRLKGRTEALY